MKILISRRTRFVLATTVATIAAQATSAVRIDAQQAVQPTKLVVSVIVDQLRDDLMDRYESAFTGGLRRLLDQGYRFTEASHAHARTSTAPGHATLSTGVFPSRHGVVANSWQLRRGVRWETMYAVGDPDSPILGFENEPLLEGRSPRTMIRDGLPDWFGEADPDSRRVSISRKDRAAIPMGGRNTEHVYWILPELGRFITSTHYMSRYPRWLDRFNEWVMPGIMEPTVWDTEVPEAYRGLARADSAAYEGDGVHTVFPHRSVDESPSDSPQQHNVWGMDRPPADIAVMALAHTVIDELELGQRDEVDYLAISLSAMDRVGHQYAPLSQEVLSTLLTVDRLLGDFFEYLDEAVGVGAWIVGFSSDHGVVLAPEEAQAMGDTQAERISRDDMLVQLSNALNDAVREGGSPRELEIRLAAEVERRGLVDRAYTHHDLTRGELPDSFATQYRNSYYPGRAWDDLSRFGVDVRYGEGDYVGFPTGTNHETPYWYDRHVPMIFLGSAIQSGVSHEPVYTVDFAPTLAALAGIPTPDDLDGRRIY
ncbi:MAG: alkaline phosphatase family protein [Gemmatimonadetes bacterium]|nr:alkaline phosphatase family protein [Gemmatimonadota bacterium]